MANLSFSTTSTNNQSNTSLQQCPATLALQGLTKSRPSIGKRDFSSMSLLSSASATTSHEPFDFPSLEWLHDDDDDVRVTNKADGPNREVVTRCLHEAIRLLDTMDAPAAVDRPQKRRRMVRSIAIPSGLTFLETSSSSSSDDLYPKKKPLLSTMMVSPLRSSEQEKPSSIHSDCLTLTGLIRQDFRGKKSSDFQENSYSKSFKTTPRTFTMNCTVSPLA